MIGNQRKFRNMGTFFIANPKIMDFHLQQKAAATVGLKKMHEFNRYGVVRVDSMKHIISFEEKKQRDSGLINGGVYVLNKQYVLSKQLPEKFSFEKDFLEKYVNERRMYGVVQDKYFIDIGIPEDYEKAQLELKTML